MDTLTTPVAAAYAAALEPLLAVVDAVPAGGWDAPSPCEGWTARDVVGHLVDTQREFLTGRGIDLGPAPDLTDPAAGLRDHAQRVLAAVGEPAVAGQRYDGFAGPTTVGETLEEFYVWDLVVHRWDLATATGQDAALTDAELDRVEDGARSWGDALYTDGICRRLEAPEGAGRQAQVLALLGRRA
ncbi:TIGR03086 family protein [Geodermatophilus dictyosporus]|uniref:TIGR03086 family protein n=1 Tax=Geodermatophilus dictyosporus TaxID=1523247 RepID=A0A1I5JG47_9ACTN|nr:TIGR03086 family metal-binding protein [Geodermatophilus dictyosporus]SFO71346.1 TIGR03086 family protein [Geodermatophilus dictyosporus]